MDVEGVQRVKVSYADSTATVTVSESVEPEALASALTGQFGGSIREP